MVSPYFWRIRLYSSSEPTFPQKRASIAAELEKHSRQPVPLALSR
jgi:hypothetical protein